MACAAALALLALKPMSTADAVTEFVVTDERSGLAIHGFDPVSYFTDGEAVLGRPDLELRHRGSVWRFRNPGNRSAFEADPEIYRPRFGGLDPMAIARGVATPGHPMLWLITGQRLYLFHSEAARRAFAGNPDRAIEAAERRWPEVRRTLLP